MKKKSRKPLIVLVIAAMVLMLLPMTAAAASPITAETWSSAVNDNVQTLTISKPADVRAGEFLLAQVTYEKGTDAWPITAPVGWNHIITTDADRGGGYKDIGQVLYWKAAENNEPASYSWRFSQKVKALGGIIRYTGVDTNDPVAAFSGRGGEGDTTGQNQLIAPSLNAAAGTKLAGFYGFKERANLDTPSGMIRLYQERDNQNDQTILAADEVVNRSGATGDRTSYSWEFDKISEPVQAEWAAQLVVLRAAGSPSAPFDGAIPVYINNQRLVLDDHPVIEGDRTLVPMRAFFEALGAVVEWDDVNFIAIGTRAGTVVRIPVGSVTPTINGIPTAIDVPARIINGRTYIPLRFAGEALGKAVVWEDSTRSIHIEDR
jgi:hypothetical protein